MKNLLRCSFVAAILASAFTLTALAQKPTLVRNQDEAGRVPYHSTITFNQDTVNCQSDESCRVSFYPVPAGYRLVATHVSAIFSMQPGAIGAYAVLQSASLNADTTVYLTATPVGNAGDPQFIISSPVSLFVEPEVYPTIVFNGFKVNRTGDAAQITLVGYLVAIP
jgi:hypothetical protein